MLQIIQDALYEYKRAGERFANHLCHAALPFVGDNMKCYASLESSQYTIKPRERYIELATIIVECTPETIHYEMLEAVHEEWELRMLVDDWYEYMGWADDGHRRFTRTIGIAREMLVEAYLGVQGMRPEDLLFGIDKEIEPVRDEFGLW